MKLNIRLLLGCCCCSFISCRATECYKNNGTIQSSIIFRGVPVPNGFNFLMKKKSNWWLVSIFQRYRYLFVSLLVCKLAFSIYYIPTCLICFFIKMFGVPLKYYIIHNLCLVLPSGTTLSKQICICIWITLYVYYKSMRNKNQYYRLRHHHHHPPSAELAFTLANKNFKKCIRFTNYLPTITATKQIVGNMQCG